MEKAQYDNIAKEYQESKLLPFRKHIEGPALLQLLGDVKGKSVLDLACGEGIYSRKLKKLGAKKVLGIDLSQEMVHLAQTLETKEKLGIEYAVGDAASLGKVGEFDIVLGSYLLNYARSREQLLSFCKSIYLNLKPGGRFVGYNDNPANDPKSYPTYRTYGFVKSAPDPRKEGDPITYTFYNPDGTTFNFDNYFLHPKTYDEVFREAGFTAFRWVAPVVTKEGLQEFGQDYWQAYLKDPPVIGVTAEKPL